MSERRPRPSGDGSGLPGTRRAVAADGQPGWVVDAGPAEPGRGRSAVWLACDV